MDTTTLIVNLIAGLIGGNAVGAAAKSTSLGAVGNSVVGAIGGAGFGWLLPLLGVLGSAAQGGGTDMGALIGNAIGGGVGGAVLTAVVGLIKNKLAAK